MGRPRGRGSGPISVIDNSRPRKCRRGTSNSCLTYIPLNCQGLNTIHIWGWFMTFLFKTNLTPTKYFCKYLASGSRDSVHLESHLLNKRPLSQFLEG